MKETPKDPVSKRLVATTEAGQRLDNYLFKHLKGVPKSYIYRIIRGGQVRINGGRVKPSSRLADGDTVRIPPLRQASEKSREPSEAPDFKISTLFEDEHLLIVDKPSGCAVHSGSGHDYGLIEILRSRMTGYLELIHRLDKETSGVLMLAKDPMALRQMHLLFSSRNKLKSIQKFYTALLVGEWRGGSRTLTHSLETVRGTVGTKRSKVSSSGREAISIFDPIKSLKGYTLVKVEIKTGRLHQVRVHAEQEGYPVAGDKLYGDKERNLDLRKLGLRRQFLHAESLLFDHPNSGAPMTIQSALPDDLSSVLSKLEQKQNVQ
ncbi:RluA family pseudouridine synthase [Gammaproteobacteria bacterium]|nr:RluA family pseudouridine synthase [Gammaproteobacteria bacterium]